MGTPNFHVVFKPQPLLFPLWALTVPSPTSAHNGTTAKKHVIFPDRCSAPAWVHTSWLFSACMNTKGLWPQPALSYTMFLEPPLHLFHHHPLDVPGAGGQPCEMPGARALLVGAGCTLHVAIHVALFLPP